MRAMGTVQPYMIGVSLISLVAGATPIKISPTAGVIGYIVTKNGGTNGGSLALANGYGASAANSYILGETESFAINGPAAFYICAGGATCVAAIITKYDAGVSLLIG